MHLDGHLEIGFFAPPATRPDEEGVIWLTLDRDGYI